VPAARRAAEQDQARDTIGMESRVGDGMRARVVETEHRETIDLGVLDDGSEVAEHRLE